MLPEPSLFTLFNYIWFDRVIAIKPEYYWEIKDHLMRPSITPVFRVGALSGFIMRVSNELQIGKAGEFLVCCDLTKKGLVAFLSGQGLPYDVLIDTGRKILRVQVKTTQKPIPQPCRVGRINPVYSFTKTKHGKKRECEYAENEVDIFALAMLDTMQVGYFSFDDMPSSIFVRIDCLRGTYYDEEYYMKYLEAQELSKSLLYTEISQKLCISYNTVLRWLKDGYRYPVPKAKYTSDIIRDKNWFLSIGYCDKEKTKEIA